MRKKLIYDVSEILGALRADVPGYSEFAAKHPDIDLQVVCYYVIDIMLDGMACSRFLEEHLPMPLAAEVFKYLFAIGEEQEKLVLCHGADYLNWLWTRLHTDEYEVFAVNPKTMTSIEVEVDLITYD